jgi:hypothetical protein
VNNQFGKECKYLYIQWDSNDTEEHIEVFFCNHENNLNKYESNCNKKDCPLLKQFLQNQKNCPQEFIDIVNKNFWDLI